ncbi:TetR/AcrR family transcriptional regulator [Allofranklinella schreckenbergeri]|uniref:TetR/AcrR family transcriptional regulator n=1 Tax=Allofranklinella schreckenbergeri TaxID=1076744 RepID=A0A3M6Q6K0_9BURK|nr:TetR/AcrR family transcriptional regulator [Allofranklinella schreckenbergeri]RMW98596.1 TetR/AcrR family transcriptional regulator [Allofranklinella schreckenbergeri]RMX02683.1 TetR/AcrR family transcriptional regulator [Allofranklinella schreckenbergeri]RMX10551.1 TetR/AcrR family transcriptional regulator [Allofranklinella schreckenbergeri]RRD41150.1 TetR family transcriptional regulator [Comamonadaceae bacterium OH3737_COT-264]
MSSPVQSNSPSNEPQSRTAARAQKLAQKKAARPARVQLTPQDWIDAAMELLVQKSIDAVNVDALSKQLGITRGSFYWHFTDREDLLARLLESWRDASTHQVIVRFERQGASPKELIAELLTLPFRGETAKRAASIELAIRAWARRDELAYQAVTAVDAHRLSYIAQCFVALQFGLHEAQARAFMLYSYIQAESNVGTHLPESVRLERREAIERLLLSPQRPVAPEAGSASSP